MELSFGTPLSLSQSKLPSGIEKITIPGENLPLLPQTKEFFPHEEPRPYQFEGANALIWGLDRYDDIILEAGPGIGKTAIMATGAMYLQDLLQKTYIAMNRKELQLQYLKDHPNMVMMWGRNNFLCLGTKKAGDICRRCPSRDDCYGSCRASEAPCRKVKNFQCIVKGSCPYMLAKKRALEADITVINNQYLFLERQYQGRFGTRDLLIFDEAHRCEEELMSLQDFTVSDENIKMVWEEDLAEDYVLGKVGGTALWKARAPTVEQALDIDFGKMWVEPEIQETFDFSPVIGAVRERRLPIWKNPLDWLVYLLETSVAAAIQASRLQGELRERQKVIDKDPDGVDVEWMKEFEKVTKACEFVESLRDRGNMLARSISNSPGDWIVEYRGKCRDHNWITSKYGMRECGEYVRGREGNVCGEPLNKFRVLFKPVVVHDFAPSFLGRIGNKRVFCSATICDIETFCSGLGIKKALFISMPFSPFPPEDRPIVFDPVGSMAYKGGKRKETLKKMPSKVTEILRRHEGERVLILPYTYMIGAALRDGVDSKRVMPTLQHTALANEMGKWAEEKLSGRDYPLLEQYLSRVKFERLIYQGNSMADRMIAVELYKRVHDAALVTTYLNEGFDGKGDLCRAIIVCKAPYSNVGDPQIGARRDRDKRWYMMKALQTWEQMCNRGVRYIGDYCVTYNLDSNIAGLVNSDYGNLPIWLKESWNEGRKLKKYLDGDDEAIPENSRWRKFKGEVVNAVQPSTKSPIWESEWKF